ncbi:UNVERIFIED_CONTAM: hypothetical protein Slati_3750300 [Sesamum latifolium]|uniref:Uncharacterized protein n=1 Tax=Sesamum latifolium TaxID=2727402 RepID=A0AAW2U2Q6_9LAMI
MALDPSIRESIFKLKALEPYTSILLSSSYHNLIQTSSLYLGGTQIGVEGITQAPQICLLGENDTLPVIISSKLSTLEEEKLIRVLREFHEAIGWTIADIKMLSHSTCMHRNLLEEGAKPS